MIANLIVTITLLFIVATAAIKDIDIFSEIVHNSGNAFLNKADYASSHDFHNAILLNNHAQLADEDIEIKVDDFASSSGYLYAIIYGSKACAAGTDFAKVLYVPLDACVDYYSSKTGIYKYSSKYIYKSTKDSTIKEEIINYKIAGCTGKSKSITVSLPTTCSKMNGYSGNAIGYSPNAWSQSEKGLYTMTYATNSCSTPYSGALIYPDVCIPDKSTSMIYTSCTSSKATYTKYSASNACTGKSSVKSRPITDVCSADEIPVGDDDGNRYFSETTFFQDTCVV